VRNFKFGIFCAGSYGQTVTVTGNWIFISTGLKAFLKMSADLVLYFSVCYDMPKIVQITHLIYKYFFYNKYLF